MPNDDTNADVTALTVQLLSAYLANNTIASEDLAGLIRTTRAALVEEAAPQTPDVEPETYTPAVSVRKSLSSPDHILSLIDGKPYKTLKRHLSTHGLTPESYRERYNLPAGYPMVAPTFAARRREIAEQIGLGNRRKSSVSTSAAAAPSEAEAATSAKPEADSTKAVSNNASKDGGAVKTGRSPASKRSRGKATAAATSSATTAPEGNSAGDAASSGSAGKKPSRSPRGKLGLFGAKGKADEAADLTAPASAADDNGPAKKPVKAKRMARAPKAAVDGAKD